MLAKFGLTSPFNKRKVKEPINKEMLPPQQHYTNTSGIPATGIPSSGIPMKKVSNIPSSTGLPVYNSHTSNEQPQKTPQQKASGLPRTNNQSYIAQFSSSESKSSGLSYGSNIKRISVNSSTKTSRSTSPSESNFSSSTNLNSTSNSTTNISVMSKQSGPKLTKLPQASTLKKKPTLPVKTATTTPIKQATNSGLKSSVSGTKTNLKPSQSPSSNNVSKLQAPSSIQLNYANNKSNNKDDIKVAKKLGSLITPSNTVNLKPPSKSSNATGPSKIAAANKEPIKSALIQPAKKSSSFGISKVTKLEKPQIAASSVPQLQAKKEMLSQSKLTNSKIPNVPSLAVESPINTGITKPTITTPKNISKPVSGLMFSSPKKLSVTVNSQTLTKKSLVNKQASNSIEAESKDPKNTSKVEILYNNVEIITTEQDENSYAEINSTANKISSVINENEDDNDLGLNDENIKPINDDNEEFQKFMNADNIDNNNKRVDQQDDDVTKLPIMSQLSPALPPPPPVPTQQTKNRHDMSLGFLPSPPPLPTHSLNLQISPQKMSMTSSLLVNTRQHADLNTFGRSNTLDRKPKLAVDFNEKVTNYQNFSNSLERKHITDSDSNYRLFNAVKANQQLIQNGSPQRNSLNLTLKPPSPNSSQRLKTPNGTYSKRPLSQDTIMENSSYLLSYPTQQQPQHKIQQSSTPSSPEHYMLMQNQSNLKIELENAKNQCFILTNQLNTSSQVVSTLEQSLSVLTYKLQKAAVSIQKKDNTISELRSYIDQVHKKHAKLFESDTKHQHPPSFATLNRHNSNESLNSLNSMISHRAHYANASSFLSSSFANENTSLNESIKSDTEKSPSKKKSWLRSSFRKAFNRKTTESTGGEKHLTSPSINSADSGLENNLLKSKCLSDVEENDFARSRFSEFDENIFHIQNNIDLSLPNSPMHQVIKPSKQMPLIGEEMSQFQRDLRDKESKLTDLRLEALATAHQLDSQKEENLKMKIEIEALKIENLKMQTFFNSQFNHSSNIQFQKVTTHQSVCSSLSSPSPSSSTSSSSNSKLNLSLSTNHVDSNSVASSILTPHSVKLKSPSHGFSDSVKGSEVNINDGKRIAMTIYLGNTDPLKEESFKNQICIGSINMSTRTNWATLDTLIRNGFKDYIEKLDSKDIPSLGLTTSSIETYYVGEMARDDFNTTPDLLPYGYLVGDHTNIIIQLKQVAPDALNDIDSLCYDTLVAKTRMQCYISLLLDHKYLLFCGPNGTCKSYIARKLGEFVANRLGKDADTSIAYYNVENKSSKDLKQFLSNITEQEGVIGADVPLVLILDNLQNIGNNSDVFHDFFNAKTNTSYVIGTINQSDVSSLNLHSNFKWVLCANHTEPVRSYLKRFLIRRRIDYESKPHVQNPDLEKIVDWIPRLWEHINKYIELYNSNDLSLGPKIFTGIPFDFKQSLNWFIELWNNHLVPFMIETVKEGVQVYGTKMSWEDPKAWIASTFPWSTYDSSVIASLYSIEPQHVGFDTDTESSGDLSSSNDDEPKKEKDFEDLDNLNNLNILERDSGEHNFVNNENDKLLSMLIRLQECTNPSRPVSTMSGFTNCGFNNYDVNNILVNESNL